MRLAGFSVQCRATGSRRPFPAAARVAGRATVVAAILTFAFLLWSTPPARAAVGLTVEVEPGLSLVGHSVPVTIGGAVPDDLTDVTLVLRIGGPAEPSQVGQENAQLPEAARLSQQLFSTPAAGTTAGSAAPGVTISGAAGAESWAVSVALPADSLPLPGAYLLTADVKSGGVVEASGTAWLGKVAPRERPLDVAFVWPVTFGVHRDPTGAFYDQVLEQAVAPASESTYSLRGLTDLPGRFPEWHFTLAVEPILVTQLRDMADGYVRLDASGGRQEVGSEDPAAKNAVEALTAFQNLVGDSSVEMVLSPYAGPGLGALAAEGWRDGFEQIQLGKQELQQTLAIESTLAGAYSPDLDMTTESLAFYGQASIDHVVVDGQLAADLTEPVAEDTVAVRVRDTENDRVTLVFANSRLRSLMTPPWNAGVFFAGLAAELAAVPRDALVITPAVDFTVPPSSYLQAIGDALRRSGWIETQTLTSLLRAHSPATRPVLLNRYAAGTQGYIEGALLSSLRAAHAAVSDLAAAADPTRAPVGISRRLLYTAESRWWWQPQTSPQVASVGLAYAEQARALAQGELEKVSFTGAGPTNITGRRGTVTLAVHNGADYPLTVEVQLSGDGVNLPDGERFAVELQPGGNEVPVNVLATAYPYRFDARLVAGGTVLDQWSQSVRPITVMTFLPWAILAVVVIGGAGFLVLRLRRRKRRSRA